MYDRNAPKAEQRNDIAGGKPLGTALLQITRIIQLLPYAALVRAEGHGLYVCIQRGLNSLRGDDLHKAGRHNTVECCEQLDGIALNSGKALGKKGAVNGPDSFRHE